MLKHRSIHAITAGAALLVTALAAVPDIATAADEAKYLEKYPDLRGQWMGVLRTRPGIPGRPRIPRCPRRPRIRIGRAWRRRTGGDKQQSWNSDGSKV